MNGKSGQFECNDGRDEGGGGQSGDEGDPRFCFLSAEQKEGQRKRCRSHKQDQGLVAP